MDINIFLKEGIKKLEDSNATFKVYITPDIPINKKDNAVKYFGSDINQNSIIGIIDTSIFSNVKDGLIFLGDRVYIKSSDSGILEIKYANLKGIDTVDPRPDKVNSNMLNFIFTINEEEVLFTSPAYNDKLNMKLVELFKDIMELSFQAGDEIFKEEEQIKPLESMHENIKLMYLKILSNYSFFGAKNLDSKVYAALMSLIVKIGMETSSRLELRSYIFDIDNSMEDTGYLLDILDEELSNTHYNILIKSLLKDLLRLYNLNNDLNNWEDDTFIRSIVSNFDIPRKEIDIILESIQSDDRVIYERLNDDQIKKSIVDLGAKAAAVGLPMAALYFSGTVGVSAAGLTSGLAALGLGGILGFSSMFTGIGVIALLGAGTYQGIKKLTGLGEAEKYRQRELLLQEIIKNNQKTLNILVEDINEISKKLIEGLKDGKESEAKIKKLSQVLDYLSNSAKSVSTDITFYNFEEIVTKIPRTLSITRLEELTNKASLEPVKTLILSCYDKDLTLRDDLSLDKARELYTVLNNIGYLNLASASIATVKSSAKDIFKDIFS